MKTTTTHVKTCPICGDVFTVTWRDKKRITCGDKCRFKAHSNLQKERGICPADIRGEKWLRVMQSPEYAQRIKELHLGATRHTANTARFSKEHTRARHFWVRSPRNTIHKVDNVRGFVRSNEHLFNPEDVVWRQGGRYHSEGCLASNGLSSLVRNAEQRHSWKGWTLEKL